MSGMRPSLLTIRFSTTCEVLRPRLERQPARRGAVGAAVVHVHVQVAAPPAARGQVGERRERDAQRAVVRRRGMATVRRSTRVLGAARDLDGVLAGRQGRARRSSGRVEIAVFEAPLAPVEAVVGVAPGARRAPSFGRRAPVTETRAGTVAPRASVTRSRSRPTGER